MTEHVQSFVNSGSIIFKTNKRGKRRKWGGKRETKTQSNDENIVKFVSSSKGSFNGISELFNFCLLIIL